jgi:hypothetical protein
MKKQKKFGRKLTLNKETIDRLDQKDKKRVFAGCAPITIPLTSPKEFCNCIWTITF